MVRNTLVLVLVLQAMAVTARGVTDPESLQMQALELLADGRHAQAQLDLEAAIAAARSLWGVHDPRLADLHLDLGRVFHARHRYSLAIDHFQRAMRLQQRAWGIYSLEQEPALRLAAETMMRADLVEEAAAQMETLLRLYHENHGPDSVQSLPTLLELAAWFRGHGLSEASLALADRAVVIARERAPASLPSALAERIESHKLHAVAGPRTVYNHSPWRTRPGLADMEELVDLVTSSPEATSDEKIRRLIELGDWYTMLDQRRKARARYAQAFALARSAPDLWAHWGPELTQPHWIQAGVSASPRAGRPIPRVDGPGSAYAFEVTAKGRARGVEVLWSNLSVSERLNRRDELRAARFRPALRDGKPVRARDRILVVVYPEAEDSPITGPTLEPATMPRQPRWRRVRAVPAN